MKKLNVKTIYQSQLAIALAACALFTFFSCEKTFLELPRNTDEATTTAVVSTTKPSFPADLKEGLEVSKLKPFDFKFLHSYCTVKGESIQIGISNQWEYSYVWELDNLPAGESPQLQCVCGHVASATVTRLVDGYSVTKYLRLTGCGPSLINLNE